MYKDTNIAQTEYDDKILKEYGKVSEDILKIRMTKMEPQALAEVYDIVNHFELNMYQKVPKKLIKLIEMKMDNDYIVNIDYSKSINKQISFRETKIILSIIFRDYICNDDLKHKLNEYDFRILEKAKQEKYDSNKIFKEKEKQVKTDENNTNVTSVSMVEYKESIFTRILNFIKKLFKR